MKRKQSNQVCRDDVSKSKQKYQNLLQDYLELQKDFVSRKKKLEAAQLKRILLTAEVRFLRRRHAYLLSLNSIEVKAKVGHAANADLSDKQVTCERNHPVNESDTGKTCESTEESRLGALKNGKKQNNCLVNGKKLGKRKISWQDPVALRAFTHI